jgi:hypothetical protein
MPFDHPRCCHWIRNSQARPLMNESKVITRRRGALLLAVHLKAEQMLQNRHYIH